MNNTYVQLLVEISFVDMLRITDNLGQQLYGRDSVSMSVMLNLTQRKYNKT